MKKILFYLIALIVPLWCGCSDDNNTKDEECLLENTILAEADNAEEIKEFFNRLSLLNDSVKKCLLIKLNPLI